MYTVFIVAKTKLGIKGASWYAFLPTTTKIVEWITKIKLQIIIIALFQLSSCLTSQNQY